MIELAFRLFIPVLGLGCLGAIMWNAVAEWRESR